MLLYSLGLTVALVVSAPWWLVRMATTSRYREGLRERLGRVPVGLREVVRGREIIWLHAVSVGEVLAASRLVGELEGALGADFRVVISTTTRTGQALARERFGAERVFYMPLDFGWAVRAFMRVLRPRAVVLMESELWPRMLHECSRGRVPVAIVNARVSDRSFRRAMKVRWVWGRVLRGVSLWLAQGDEDARRLVAMGARVESVRVVGNLKYDVRAPKESRVAELIKEAAEGRPIVVAGSTVDDHKEWKGVGEEEIIIRAWQGSPRTKIGALLVIAPRHPERFSVIESLVAEFKFIRASDWIARGGSGRLLPQTIPHPSDTASKNGPPGLEVMPEVVLLDTIGDLAAVYGVADVAFVGGSLVKRGGHNPLEPAQFGVPVVMGPSFENFRDVVERMLGEGGIWVLGREGSGAGAFEVRGELGEGPGLKPGSVGVFDRGLKPPSTPGLGAGLEAALLALLTDREAARAMGERGRRVFEEQQGATGRAVAALVEMIQ